MTAEEANKIIAEFMGWSDFVITPFNTLHGKIKGYERIVTNYISLDALVPVWEKLGFGECHIPSKDHRNEGKFYYFIDWNRDYSSIGHSKTIQKAAAKATAKAIQELNEI